MKAPRLLRRLLTWCRLPETQRAIAMVAISVGAAMIKATFEEDPKRLCALEDGGLVPREDLATVGDLERLRGEIEAVEGRCAAQVPSHGIIDATVVDEASGATEGD